MLRVNVTARDLARAGKMRDMNELTHCPIALAIRRHRGWSAAEVGADTVYRLESSYALPDQAQEFIRRWDIYKPVEPFVFLLDLP